MTAFKVSDQISAKPEKNVEAKPYHPVGMENVSGPAGPESVKTADSVQGTKEQPVSEMVTASDQQTVTVVTEESSSTKWIVIVVVLVLLIITLAGGAFFYLTQFKYTPSGEWLSPQPADADLNLTDQAKPSEASETPDLSKSDEVEDISQDLENTDMGKLDEELKAIDEDLL